MPDLETQIKDAWASYIAAHGERNHVELADIATSVFREREARFKTDVPVDEWGDFERIERYIDKVGAAKFTRDVTYQLYYVTECLIWLWKRLPPQILLRTEEAQSADERIGRLLRDLNAGKSSKEFNQQDLDKIPNAKQGDRLTPANGVGVVDPIVKRVEIEGDIREVALVAQSHEPPPPPPGWPGE